MKVKELIKELQGLDSECQVRVVADHGQVVMQAQGAEYSYLHNHALDEYMPDEVHKDDLNDYEEGEITRIVVIYSN